MATIKGMDDFKKKLTQALNKIKSPQTMKEIGEQTADRIRKRTRLGRSVPEPDGSAGPMPKLSEGYKKQRKKMKLHGQTTASKSNLTKTGQMLDSVSVVASGYGSATVGAKGDRTDSDKSNAEIAAFAHQGSNTKRNQRPKRPFLFLSKAEKNAIQKLFSEMIAKILGT